MARLAARARLRAATIAARENRARRARAPDELARAASMPARSSLGEGCVGVGVDGGGGGDDDDEEDDDDDDNDDDDSEDPEVDAIAARAAARTKTRTSRQ